MAIESVKECFAGALIDENRGRKHKGLLKAKPDLKEAAKALLTFARI